MIMYAKWSNSRRKLERLGTAWLVEGLIVQSLCAVSLAFFILIKCFVSVEIGTGILYKWLHCE